MSRTATSTDILISKALESVQTKTYLSWVTANFGEVDISTALGLALIPSVMSNYKASDDYKSAKTQDESRKLDREAAQNRQTIADKRAKLEKALAELDKMSD